MWPLRRRKPKQKSWRIAGCEELRDKFPVGSTVNYLGVECSVVSTFHSTFDINSGTMSWPELTLRYKDNLGVLRTLELNLTEAKRLHESLTDKA